MTVRQAKLPHKPLVLVPQLADLRIAPIAVSPKVRDLITQSGNLGSAGAVPQCGRAEKGRCKRDQYTEPNRPIVGQDLTLALMAAV
jgi:hypothetical protein